MDQNTLYSQMTPSAFHQQTTRASGPGRTSGNACVYGMPTTAQPHYNQVLDNTSASSPLQFPPQALINQTGWTSGNPSPYHVQQHFVQQEKVVNMSNGYFPAPSQNPPTYYQLETMSSSSHNYIPSLQSLTQPYQQSNMPINGVSPMQPNDIIQYSYEQFLRRGLDTSHLSQAATSNTSSFPVVQVPTTNPVPQTRMVNTSNYGSTQNESPIANPILNTQNIGNKNGDKHASNNAYYVEAHFLPAAIEPSKATNNYLTYSTDTFATNGQSPTKMSQSTTATKRSSNSLKSTVEGPGGKRRKGNASNSTRANRYSSQKSNRVPLTQPANVSQAALLATARKKATKAFNQAYTEQQPSTAGTCHVQSHSHSTPSSATIHLEKAGTNAGSMAQYPSVNGTGHNIITHSHASTDTTSTYSCISIESGLEKMLELSGAIKYKTMPRAEALREMDKVIDLVERNIRDHHHVLSRKEDEDVSGLRLAYSLTRVTYD